MSGTTAATLTAFGPLLSTLLSFGVAAYAVSVATRQSRTAEEKLRLDFFDRRFQAWKAINDAVNGRMAYIADAPRDQIARGEIRPETFLTAFWDAKRQAQYLFGPDVQGVIQYIESGMMDYAIARVSATQIEMAPIERRAAVAAAPGDTFMVVAKRQEELARLVGPYLDLSHIAVMRPSLWTRFRSAWTDRWSRQTARLAKVFAPPRGPSGSI